MTSQKNADEVSVNELVKALQEVFGVQGPETELSLNVDWFSGVPEGAVTYLNAFRLKYFEYDRHLDILDKFFRTHSVRRVGDLGCGVATHLVRLAERGYDCVGIDQSEESLALAAKNAQEANVKLTLIKGDIRTVQLQHKLDAIISMHVPLSSIGSDEALSNAHRFLQDEGFFAKVHGTPDPRGVPEHANIYDVDVIEDEAFRVARFEHWWINDEIISWNAYYFVRKSVEGESYSNDVLVFVDRTDIHLNRTHNREQLEEKWRGLGYELVAMYPIPDSRGAPPWSEENLIFLQKLI